MKGRVAWTNIHYHTENREAVGIHCVTQGAQTGALCQPRELGESGEELKSLWMKLKEEREKVGLSSTFRKLRSWHLVPSPHGK